MSTGSIGYAAFRSSSCTWLSRRFSGRLELDRGGYRGGALLRAHVRDHRHLPSLFFPSHLQDLAAGAIYLSPSWARRRPSGAALVGRQSSRTSSQFRYARRPPFAGALRFLSLPHAAGSCATVFTPPSTIASKTLPASLSSSGSIAYDKAVPLSLASLLYLSASA